MSLPLLKAYRSLSCKSRPLDTAALWKYSRVLYILAYWIHPQYSVQNTCHCILAECWSLGVSSSWQGHAAPALGVLFSCTWQMQNAMPASYWQEPNESFISDQILQHIVWDINHGSNMLCQTPRKLSVLEFTCKKCCRLCCHKGCTVDFCHWGSRN